MQNNNTCSVCGNEYIGFGNNAKPINNGRCCGICNSLQVIPARLEDIQKRYLALQKQKVKSK